MEIENLSKIMFFMYFLRCIFSSKSIFSVLVKLRLSITIWLTFVLYSNIFQLYIEFTGLALREVQYVITSNFPT